MPLITVISNWLKRWGVIITPVGVTWADPININLIPNIPVSITLFVESPIVKLVKNEHVIIRLIQGDDILVKTIPNNGIEVVVDNN